jgi:hypothetical protein
MNVGSAGIGPIMLIVMVPAQCGQGVVASVFAGALMSLRLPRLVPRLCVALRRHAVAAREFEEFAQQAGRDGRYRIDP